MTATSVSTHVLDTSVGRPARGVPVETSVLTGRDARWEPHGTSRTDADGRCDDLPVLPEGTTRVRLRFDVEPYFAARRSRHRRAGEKQDTPRTGESAEVPGGFFFPEVAVTFTVTPGEHHHVPLLLNPFGYSVYRGS